MIMAGHPSSLPPGQGFGPDYPTRRLETAGAASNTGASAAVNPVWSVQQGPAQHMPGAPTLTNIPFGGAPVVGGRKSRTSYEPVESRQHHGNLLTFSGLQVNVGRFVPFYDFGFPQPDVGNPNPQVAQPNFGNMAPRVPQQGQAVPIPFQRPQYGNSVRARFPQGQVWPVPPQYQGPFAQPLAPRYNQPQQGPYQGPSMNRQLQMPPLQQPPFINQNLPIFPGPPAPAPAALPAPPRPGRPMLTGNSRIGARVQRGQGGYGDLIRGKPPVNTKPPKNIDIGMIEICTFFPNWFLIPDVAMRAMRNGWTRKDIAKAQLHAMNRLDRDNMKTAENRIQKQISDGGKFYQNLEEGEHWDSGTQRENLGPEDDLTAKEWETRTGYQGLGSGWGHVLLVTVANTVVNWPRNQDRLLVTQCIRYAVANPHLQLDTSHFHWIIQTQGFHRPPLMDDLHDRQAVQRLRQNVRDPDG